MDRTPTEWARVAWIGRRALERYVMLARLAPGVQGFSEINGKGWVN